MESLVRIGAVFASIALTAQGAPWEFIKDDAVTGRRSVEIHAMSFDQSPDGRIKYLHQMSARLYDPHNAGFRRISSREAVVDLRQGTLAYGPDLKIIVSIRNSK